MRCSLPRALFGLPPVQYWRFLSLLKRRRSQPQRKGRHEGPQSEVTKLSIATVMRSAPALLALLARAPPENPLPSVHFYIFAAERNLWLRVSCAKRWGPCTVSKNRYHVREAAAALLKMARTTSDPAVAAGLIEAAANLKDEVGELPPPVSIKAPDVQPEEPPGAV